MLESPRISWRKSSKPEISLRFPLFPVQLLPPPESPTTVKWPSQVDRLLWNRTLLLHLRIWNLHVHRPPLHWELPRPPQAPPPYYNKQRRLWPKSSMMSTATSEYSQAIPPLRTHRLLWTIKLGLFPHPLLHPLSSFILLEAREVEAAGHALPPPPLMVVLAQGNLLSHIALLSPTLWSML